MEFWFRGGGNETTVRVLRLEIGSKSFFLRALSHSRIFFREVLRERYIDSQILKDGGRGR